MKKSVKLISLLILIFVSSVGLFGNALAGGERYKDSGANRQISKSFGTQARFYPLLKDTASVYRIMQDTEDVYKKFLSGKLSGNFGGKVFTKKANFEQFNTLFISDSLDPAEMSSHGPYKNYTGIRLIINRAATGSQISVLIFDNTAHRPIALKTTKKRKIVINSRLNKTHSYTVFIFNKSGEKRISYFGKLMFSN